MKFSFFKKDDTQEQPTNPNFMLTIRVLAVGYLGYCLLEIIKLYRAGGADAPSLPLLIGAIVVLGGGAIWIGITSYLQWKQAQAAQTAKLDEEDNADPAESEDVGDSR